MGNNRRVISAAKLDTIATRARTRDGLNGTARMAYGRRLIGPEAENSDTGYVSFAPDTNNV